MGFSGWKGEVAAAAGLFVAAELKAAAAADRGSAEAQTDDEREREGRKERRWKDAEEDIFFAGWQSRREG